MFEYIIDYCNITMFILLLLYIAKRHSLEYND